SVNIWCNVEALGTIGNGGNFYGTKLGGAAPRTLPGSGVFDYYVANGTSIPLTSLPTWSGTRALNGGVLAPTVNTIAGGTNADGIYVIDCQGQLFTIGNVRIVGTVVLLNCGGLTIKSSVRWSP